MGKGDMFPLFPPSESSAVDKVYTAPSTTALAPTFALISHGYSRNSVIRDRHALITPQFARLSYGSRATLPHVVLQDALLLSSLYVRVRHLQY